jgi:hypothetical protein
LKTIYRFINASLFLYKIFPTDAFLKSINATDLDTGPYIKFCEEINHFVYKDLDSVMGKDIVNAQVNRDSQAISYPETLIKFFAEQSKTNF